MCTCLELGRALGEGVGAAEEVGEVEVGDVVARDDVRVGLLDEGAPLGQQVLLGLVHQHLRAWVLGG